MKPSRWSVLGLLLTAAGASGASAQVVGPVDSCNVIVSGEQSTSGYYNTCAAGDLARLDTIYIPYVVARAVYNSFGIGPPVVEPTGLDHIIAGEADQRLQPSVMSIAPAADVSAPAAAPAVLWNGWVNGRGLYSDYTAAGGGLDGPTATGIAGLDYKLTSKLTLGLLTTVERSRLDSPLNDYNSNNFGIGPYLGWVMTDNLVFSASAQRSWIDSDSTAGLLNFETDRVQASAAINGYWYKDNWRFNPSLTLTWSKDWETETNGLFPDREIEIGILVPAVQLGKTFRLSDTTTVEPWAGAAMDVTFLNDVRVTGAGTTSDPNTDLRIQTGLNFGIGNNAQLAITGEMAGVLLNTFDSYSIEANLAVQF